MMAPAETSGPATVTNLSHGLERRYSARARTDYVRGGRLDKTILSVTQLGNRAYLGFAANLNGVNP